MTTVQSILYDVHALLAEYNEGGVIAPPSATATIDTNAIRFINMAMQEIYDKTRTLKTHKITRIPTPNLLGNGAYLKLDEFIGEDVPTIGVTGAKSYYFEVDNDAIVRIEENVLGVWTTLSTINTTGTTELTSFKGLITPSSATNEVRLVFTGTTYYRFSNVALYAFPFKLADIPEYGGWIKYILPSDFGTLDKIVSEFPVKNYQIDSYYKFEGHNELFVSYDYNGELRVIYSPIPTYITSFTDTLPVINPKAIQFITYYVAAKVALEENPGVANYFEQKSNELKIDSMKGQPASEQAILDVYSF